MCFSSRSLFDGLLGIPSFLASLLLALSHNWLPNLVFILACCCSFGCCFACARWLLTIQLTTKIRCANKWPFAKRQTVCSKFNVVIVTIHNTKRLMNITNAKWTAGETGRAAWTNLFNWLLAESEFSFESGALIEFVYRWKV